MSKNYGSKKYIWKVAIALDQLLNTLLAGWPDETLSSRTYRLANLADCKKKRWVIAEKVINAIFFWQKDHCYQSYLSELERNHSVK